MPQRLVVLRSCILSCVRLGPAAARTQTPPLRDHRPAFRLPSTCTGLEDLSADRSSAEMLDAMIGLERRRALDR